VQSRKTHLSTHAIWWWPRKIVLLHDLRVDDDPLQLLHHGLVDEGLLADHGVVLVVGIVGVPQLAVRPELELQELVAELALVTDVVAQVEVLRGHDDALFVMVLWEISLGKMLFSFSFPHFFFGKRDRDGRHTIELLPHIDKRSL